MKNNKTIAQFLGIKDFPYCIKDNNGKTIYYEESDGYWWKREFDSSGNIIYLVDSNGNIRDNRPKVIELTLEQIAQKFGTNVSNIKIKK